MQALFILAPGRTEVREVPEPTLSPDEVLLRVGKVGYCGSDLSTFCGRNPMVSLPRVPGHEVGATIEQTGSRVPPDLTPGMRVTISPYSNCGACASCRRGRPNACANNQTLGVQRDGAMTQLLAVPWQRVHASRNLSLRALALVEPLAVGFHAAARGDVSNSDVVAVLGCGAVGLGVIAGAAARGATVIAVDVDDRKLALARRSGAAHAINSRSTSLHDGLTSVAPAGPDVIIEAIGLPQTFRAAVDEVAFTGRVVYIGYAKDAVAYDTRLIVQKELDIRGSRNALAEFPHVIAMLEQGRFPVDDVITREVPLSLAGEALAQWSLEPAAVTRILVDLDGV